MKVRVKRKRHGFQVFPYGVKMGVEHVEHGKPNSTKTCGRVFIGYLDTNDQDETEECFDAYETNGYLDERTGLMLDDALTKQAET